ncbi:36755_t:CDS:2, partial [Gigaspora margarita]
IVKKPEPTITSYSHPSKFWTMPMPEIQALVVQALNSIRQEQLMIESHMIMPPGSASSVSENGTIFLINYKEIEDVSEF